ncbi:MAG: hypothetical protein LC109_02885 [Bacteroidia bacterium]|nr:hypothetical protein [Bacteroidia bacterium]
MKSLKIYLTPTAYYVRIDLDYLEEFKKKTRWQKLGDDRKEMQLFDFIEFEELDEDLYSDFPKKVTKLGVLGSRYHCYNPFDHKYSPSTKIMIPEKIIIISDSDFRMIFSEAQTRKLSRYDNKYYTAQQNLWITEIQFSVDKSMCNLFEKIKYSNGNTKSNKYHLISKSTPMSEPDWYALFDFN